MYPEYEAKPDTSGMDAGQRRIILVVLLLALSWPPQASVADGNGNLKMDAVTVSPQSGERLGSSSSQGHITAFFTAEKSLVGHILAQVGISPQNLPQDIQEEFIKPQTTNVKAFMAFSQGLDYLDQAKFVLARESFALAVQLDPGFTLAKNFHETTPDAILALTEITSRSAAQGHKAVSTILKNPESKTLGSTLATDDANKPAPLVIVNEMDESPRIEATPGLIGAACDLNPTHCIPLAPSILNHSEPICTGDLCGFYSTFLKKQEATPSQGGPLIRSAYQSEQGLALTKSPTLTIAQLDTSGYLQGDAGSTLTNIHTFVDGLSGIASSSPPPGIALDGRIVNDVAGQLYGYPSVAAGYYQGGDPQKLRAKDGDYTLFNDRLFFAEGKVTPAADLATLAQQNAVYTYSGIAGGDLMVQQTGGTTPMLESWHHNSGQFSAEINFGSGVMRNFNASVAFDQANVTIRAETAQIHADGAFAIAPGAVGTAFQIQSLNASQGLVSGRTFGPEAAAVGGVFSLRAQESTGASVKDWAAAGFFSGGRANAGGSVTDTASQQK